MEWFERARELAAQQKIAHEKIAERIGRGRSTVSGWLAGEREPKLQELSLLAKVLGVTPQYLLFGDQDQYDNSQIMPYSDVIEIPIFEGEKKQIGLYWRLKVLIIIQKVMCFYKIAVVMPHQREQQ
ncbi:helix-turn-helix domain-containing protein [Acerihabitans sp. KWT182]|uniref:Helix-turn-helix domain-containing protein n=1 Tax=Acerihabitans sp. KWT182 TaxID=3157919 RepID=A0AAU7QDZ1_9GAMM